MCSGTQGTEIPIRSQTVATGANMQVNITKVNEESLPKFSILRKT